MIPVASRTVSWIFRAASAASSSPPSTDALATNARSDRLASSTSPKISVIDSASQGSMAARAMARRMNCMTSSTCSSGTGIITYGIEPP